MHAHRVINVWTLKDYENAKKEATNRIVRKQSRGNVSAQNGWFMSKEELAAKSKQADIDIQYIMEALHNKR